MTIKWYDSSLMGTPLTSTTPLTNNHIYYATQIIEGIESNPSTPVTVTVNNITAGVIATNQTICSGTNPAALTETTPATANGTISYQWQCNTGSEFCDIAGATAASYTPPPGLSVTKAYRRIVKATFNKTTCSATSNVVTVTVNNITAGVITTNQTIRLGTNPIVLTETIPATANGAISYQWQSNTGSGFYDIAGATEATHTPPPGLSVTTTYRRIAKATFNETTCSATSNVVTVTVNNITAGVIVANQTICVGTNPIALTETTPATANGMISYQWQSNTGSGFYDIAGATKATYTPPTGLSVTKAYRRIVKATFNKTTYSKTSNIVTITVNNITAGVIATNQTICVGTNPATLTETTPATANGMISYQWQSNTGSGFYDIAGATAASYTPPTGLRVTTAYQRIATSTLNNISCSATSNIVTITSSTTIPTTITGENNVCINQEVIYRASTSMIDYTWVVEKGTIIDGGQINDAFVKVLWQNSGEGLVGVSYNNGRSCDHIGLLEVTISNCSDLALSKIVDNFRPTFGDIVSFIITASNKGQNEFTDIVIRENLPNGYTHVSSKTSSGNFNSITGIWNIPTLKENRMETLTVNAKVLDQGNYINEVFLESSKPQDIYPDNNTAQAWIEPECIVVYNEFSPNGDGNNDFFVIGCIENYPNNRLEIYNRDGRLVYEKNNYQNDWNGVANVTGVLDKGLIVPQGAYYYTLDFNKGNNVKKGWVYIIR